MIKYISYRDFQNNNNKLVINEGKKQVLLLEENRKLFAIDNRCPHQGFPLSQGTTNGKCTLTCNYHNWKFDLETGKALVGSDRVKTYKVNRIDDQISIDLSDPPLIEIKKRIEEEFLEAFEKREYGRMARELTRYKLNGIDPLEMVKFIILESFDKFEFGMSHAYGALADWIHLYENEVQLEKQIAFLMEAIDHIALDTLRQPSFSYNIQRVNYSDQKLRDAVEREQQGDAESLIYCAFEEGLEFSDLERVLSEIALSHYQGFGHSLIFVTKVKELCEIFNDKEVQRAFTLCLVRSLIFATREDLLAEFKNYSNTLAMIEKDDFGQALGLE